MTTKYLITTSIFALILVSVAQASEDTVFEPTASAVIVPAFSWTGFYLGGQIGGLSGRTSLSYLGDGNTRRVNPIKKENLPQLSGFVGGIYAGSNVDIERGFIIGIDTDIMWSGKKDTKAINAISINLRKIERSDRSDREKEEEYRDEDLVAFPGVMRYTLKQKWFGATRVRVGFSADRVMPYVAGGIAYTQLRNIYKKSDEKKRNLVDFADFFYDEKKTMVGYTLGGGVDFAMADNMIMRAEYRYSDFGKKKFAHDKMEIGYKTNDFRVGIAYKF
ncbi:outer membrane protein [Bartonella sp. CB74]|uniref:outer membrane protein n=1 Tax=Bartonella sp. CB74 TaxID=3113620 RepID=UPI002F969DB2